jgi:hypothetical protein
LTKGQGDVAQFSSLPIDFGIIFDLADDLLCGWPIADIDGFNDIVSNPLEYAFLLIALAERFEIFGAFQVAIRGGLRSVIFDDDQAHFTGAVMIIGGHDLYATIEIDESLEIGKAKGSAQSSGAYDISLAPADLVLFRQMIWQVGKMPGIISKRRLE